MIKAVNLITCDACKKKIELDSDNKIIPDGWTNSGDLGDLCPSCSTAWNNLKQSFIEKMRMNSKESII